MQQSDPPRDVAAERGVRPAVPTRADVDALMKRCQIGVGGRRALDDAHDIMAECYGTLGALMTAVERLRAEMELAHTFINAAAGEGLVLDGVDAAELYVALYPERYAATAASIGA